MQKIFLSAILILGTLNGLIAQCLSLSACPAILQTVCDSSANDGQLWNDTYWFDPLQISHDLSEAPTELSIQITDSCGPDDLQVSYVLLLDLDSDGIRETAISSNALPGADLVYFGNAANPNYTGGEARHFDARPVPANQKYGFALEKNVAGNLLTARVRWATTLTLNTYAHPQLPAGNHRIAWRFEKNGEIKTCSYDFTVRDCQAPTIDCINGLSVNIMPTTMIQIWTIDFLAAAKDNITPVAQLKYAVRRAGTGTGFPVDNQGLPVTYVLFTCQDLGTQPVELWAIDATGNAGFCTTAVVVQDNNQNCVPGSGAYTACAKSACSGFMGGVEEVSFEISGSSPAVPPFSFFDLTGADGCASFDPPIPFAANLKITPSKDVSPFNNGVGTFDLILLGKHLNGTQPFTENWQWVAADTDVNGVIDSADLRHCKQLLLGEMDSVVYPGLRFYPLDFVFPVGNPLALPIPNYIMVDPAAPNVPIEFAAVKTCDFNCNSIITDLEETAFSPGNIGPAQSNPTTAGLSISLVLPQPASVAVEIADLSGRVVYRSAAPYSAGDQRLEVPARAFPQAGLYVWRVQAGEAWQTGRVLKQ